MTQHQLMDVYRAAGGLPEVFNSQEMAYLMIHGNEIVTSHLIEGLELDCQPTETGMNINFTMRAGYKFDKPVNICFGLVPESGLQQIIVNGTIEDGAQLEFLAYCVFPNAVQVRHEMEGNIQIGDGATFKYTEVHYHGNEGGIEVIPNLKVDMGKDSRYIGNFYLTKGRAGLIRIDYEVEVGENSRAELLVKVLSSGTDDIEIKEALDLSGKGSRGTASTRIVGKDDSRNNVINRITARREGCIGHVDCIETLVGNAQAKATPIVDVRDRRAIVTHEAAIGSINSKQLETVMAKGHDESAATDILIQGLLR